MVRRILNLSLVLVTLAASREVVAQVISDRDSTNLPTVSLCNVVRNPTRYSNKIFRMQATYLSYYHGAYLYGRQCNQPAMYVDPYIPCDGKDGKTCNALQKTLNDLVPRVWPSTAETDLVLIGRFRRVSRRSRNRDGTISIRGGPNADLRFEFRFSQIEPGALNKN
jgi:hypothetical protein